MYYSNCAKLLKLVAAIDSSFKLFYGALYNYLMLYDSMVHHIAGYFRGGVYFVNFAFISAKIAPAKSLS